MAKNIIIEAQNSNTSFEQGTNKGILGKLAGVFADYTRGTRNSDRLYPEKLWDERVFGSEDVQEALETKTLFGELDHPEGDRCETLAQNAAISITKLEKRPDEGVIYGEADILDTPTGRIVKALADSGAQLGISSRGMGEEIMEDGQNIIDPDTYDFITFDVVVTPANTKARVSLVESKRINKLTESLKKEIKDCETENQLDQVKNVVETINISNKDELTKLIEEKSLEFNPGENEDIDTDDDKVEADKLTESKDIDSEKQPDPKKYYKGNLYRVFDKNYNLLTYGFKEEQDAINFAENNDDAKYIEELYYDGIIEDNTDEGEIIWNKDKKEESAVTNKTNIIALKIAENKYKELKQELEESLKTNSELQEKNNKLTENIKQLYRKNVTLKIENKSLKQEKITLEENKSREQEELVSKNSSVITKVNKINNKKVENLEIKYNNEIKKLNEQLKIEDKRYNKLLEENKKIAESIKLNSKIISDKDLQISKLQEQLNSQTESNNKKLQESKSLQESKVNELNKKLEKLLAENKQLKLEREQFTDLAFTPTQGLVSKEFDNLDFSDDFNAEDQALFNALL